MYHLKPLKPQIFHPLILCAWCLRMGSAPSVPLDPTSMKAYALRLIEIVERMINRPGTV